MRTSNFAKIGDPTSGMPKHTLIARPWDGAEYALWLLLKEILLWYGEHAPTSTTKCVSSISAGISNH